MKNSNRIAKIKEKDDPRMTDKKIAPAGISLSSKKTDIRKIIDNKNVTEINQESACL